MDYPADDGDLHICGHCKQSFGMFDQWLEHKQLQWCKQSVQAENASSPKPLSHQPSTSEKDSAMAGESSSVDDTEEPPIHRRSLYPIMPPRKRERARSRKQESPQSIKLEEVPNTCTLGEHSPLSPATDLAPSDHQFGKRPRGRPRKESNQSIIVSQQNTSNTQKSHPTGVSEPPSAAVGTDVNNTPNTQSLRRPLVLPRVYSCPRCLKSFIKLSHLHRHMNKKKPCEAKEVTDSMDDNSEFEDVRLSVSSDSVTFTCGLCSEVYQSYEEVLSHHSEKHPAYYPGYCKFCGKFQDRKNKLLIHLAKHDQPEIVNEVAQEVKRVRHIKIEKQSSSVGQLSTGPPSASQSLPCSPPEFVCITCKSRFAVKEELLYHFRDFHVPIGCHVTETDLIDLLDVKSSSGSDSLKCFICCLKFQTKEAFEQHVEFHQVWSEKAEPGIENLRGVDTGGGDEYKDLKSHLLNHEKNNNNADNAGMVIDLSMGKKKENFSNSINDSNGSPEETELLDFPCWLCPAQHSDVEAWRNHIKNTHQIPTVYRCVVEDCRLEFKTWNELYDHRTEHTQRSYICKICNDHQPTRALLASHSLIHLSNKRLSASICSYCNAVVQENMELHRIKCSQQLVSCSECGEKVKRFLLNKHLTNHSIATGKMYKCDHCDSSFPIKNSLNQHIKNVHGPRKFVCTDCGAAFKRNDKLQRHCQSRHSDIKPYLCPIASCGRAFKRVDGLKAHVRCAHVSDTQSINDSYGCTVCGQTLSGQEKLLDHLMSHVKTTPSSVSSLSGELYGSAEKPGGSTAATSARPSYECPYCGIKLLTEQLFYTHVVQHSQLAAFHAPPMAFSPAFYFSLAQNRHQNE